MGLVPHPEGAQGQAAHLSFQLQSARAIVNGHWAGSTDIGTHPAGYAPAGVGDFNGDHTPDIAWFNAATGDFDIWLIANGHWAGS